MRRVLTAIRVFLVALFSGKRSRQFAALLNGEISISTEVVSKKLPERTKAAVPVRSEALTLLATLQREARLVDFLQESLEGYSDVQIGAAARDVHRDCGKVLQRLFALEPIEDKQEGSELEVAVGFDPSCYRLVGDLGSELPFRGRMVHHGWQATRCRVPTWSGNEDAARVVAPVEVEL